MKESQERIMILMLIAEAIRFHENDKQLLDLRGQVEAHWDELEGSEQEKYDRIKCQLTSQFLWQKGLVPGYERDLYRSPGNVLQDLQSRQRARLMSLPPGQ
jgi:hypothetical protein